MTAVTTDLSGVRTSEVRYMPWGTDRYTYGTTPTTVRYTGQRQESSIGLYFYGARWYDSALGRFTSPDTIIPAQQGVMGNDRYAYTNNNPLSYTDPTGHMVDDGCETSGCTATEAEIAYDTQRYYYMNCSRGYGGGCPDYGEAIAFTALGLITVGFAGAAVETISLGAVGTISEIGTTATTTACADGDCGNEATSVAQSLGQAGEIASGIVKNTLHIPSLTGTATYRIPDQLLPDQRLISEVKNVAQLFLTNQIQDFVAFAQQKGYTFELWTRATTKLSAPLQKLIDSGTIVQKILGLK